MYDIDSKARELAASLTNSKFYKNYRETYEKIKDDEFLMVRINDYRRRNFAIHSNGDNVKQETEALFSDFRDVFENKDAKNFLDAELALCRVIQKVNATIMADIDMDLNFL